MKTQVFVSGEESSTGSVKQILVDDSLLFPPTQSFFLPPPRLGAERIPL